MIVERNDTRVGGGEIKTSFSDKNKKEYGPGIGGPSNRGDEAEAQKLNDAYYDKVNIGKTCDIAILTKVGADLPELSKFKFGSWRDKNGNGLLRSLPF
jgi:hypothetical protein